MRAEYAFSERRACRLMTVVVSSYRYETTRSDEPLRTQLVELAREKPRFGYRRLSCFAGRLGRACEPQAGASGVSGGGADDPAGEAETLRAGSIAFASLDGGEPGVGAGFLHDAVDCGRAIRVLSVAHAYTRECLALEVDTSFASRRVTRVLDAIVAERGQPQAIRCDNGPELTSRHFLAWCVDQQIELVPIQPGKPTQNAHAESFHDGCGKSVWR